MFLLYERERNTILEIRLNLNKQYKGLISRDAITLPPYQLVVVYNLDFGNTTNYYVVTNGTGLMIIMIVTTRSNDFSS